jgi:hypothetical protein
MILVIPEIHVHLWRTHVPSIMRARKGPWKGYRAFGVGMGRYQFMVTWFGKTQAEEPHR